MKSNTEDLDLVTNFSLVYVNDIYSKCVALQVFIMLVIHVLCRTAGYTRPFSYHCYFNARILFVFGDLIIIFDISRDPVATVA